MKQVTNKSVMRWLWMLLFVAAAFLPVLLAPTKVQAGTGKVVQKDGYEYYESIHMDKKVVMEITVDADDGAAKGMREPRLKVKNVKSDSKNLKARIETTGWVDPYHGIYDIRLYATKNGVYNLSYDVYLKDKWDETQKKVKLKTTVYVSNTDPIKSISIDGKKLEDMKDWYSNRSYFSEKYKGKIKVTANKNFKILKIKNKGVDKSSEGAYFSGGKAATVKNGKTITLNHISKGKHEGMVSTFGADGDGREGDDMLTEKYHFAMAKTWLSVQYEDTLTHEKRWHEFQIYTETD